MNRCYPELKVQNIIKMHKEGKKYENDVFLVTAIVDFTNCENACIASKIFNTFVDERKNEAICEK